MIISQLEIPPLKYTFLGVLNVNRVFPTPWIDFKVASFIVNNSWPPGTMDSDGVYPKKILFAIFVSFYPSLTKLMNVLTMLYDVSMSSSVRVPLMHSPEFLMNCELGLVRHAA